MIRIMVDSASDCGREEYDAFISMTINIEGKEYRGGIDLMNDEFYRILANTGDFPQTSQPAPTAFIESFQAAKEAGDELIYFSISSVLSGTYQSANIAKAMVEYDGIYIVDTLSASHMVGMMAEYAKRWAEEGVSAKEIVARCEALKGRIRVLAGVDTLEYLKRGGRIGKAAALVGSLANIKPLIAVVDGGVEPLAKALGFGRAIQTLTEKIKAYEIDPAYPVCSLYTYGEENVEKLEEKLQEAGIQVQDRKQVGPTIGTHVGPGVYGLFFVEA